MKVSIKELLNKIGWKSAKMDMFRQTQRQLTLQYSAVLIAFLILFMTMVYSLLYYLLVHEQKNQLQTWITNQAHAIQEYQEYEGDHWEKGYQTYLSEALGEYSQLDQRVTGYFVDAFGAVLGMNKDGLALAKLIAKSKDGWTLSTERTVYKTFYIENIRKEPLERDDNHDRDHRDKFLQNHVHPQTMEKSELLVAARKLSINGREVGTFYVAKDTTAQERLIHWLSAVLLGVAVLFCGLALFLSYNMSSRAMIPISRSFHRQREFVADASHELRTPLSVMLSSIDVLEMEDISPAGSYFRQVLANMKDEAKRMIRLSDNLLTLARSDAGQPVIQRVSFDIRSKVEKLLQSLQPVSERKGISLQLDAPQSLVVDGDEERLLQLLVILLDNAMKYTPYGGKVSLQLSLSYAKNKKLIIKVQDTGIGVAETEQAHIFDRFYRVDKSRSRDMGGHGLGLSIAKWIVEAHQGMIKIASTLGQGSIFTVEIPQP